MIPALRIYKSLMFIGIVILVTTLYIAWHYINQYESSLGEPFARAISTQLELQGLEDDIKQIDRILTAYKSRPEGESKVEVDGIDYSAYEVERLRQEKSSLELFAHEKQMLLDESSGFKNRVMANVKILFAVSLIASFAGILFVAFGIVGWYLRIELFEDRRKTPR